MFGRKPILIIALATVGLFGLGCPSGNNGGSGGDDTNGTADGHTTENGGGDTGSNEAGKFGTGVITGTVKFTGNAPARKPLRRNSDPYCAETKMLEEDVIVEDGKLHNVIVRVTKGVSGTYEKGEPIEIDQDQCMYRPRVSVGMAGGTIKIVNGDETLHNVHVYKGKATVFNKAMPPNSDPIDETFSDGGQIFKFKCDVHPWMAGYLALSDNPFNDVAEDGTFKIEKLPAGEYTLEAWHEKYGMKTAQVTVKDGEEATVDFEYSGTETAMK